MSPPMSTVPAVMNLSPLDSVIETINSVAAGAGTVKVCTFSYNMA